MFDHIVQWFKEKFVMIGCVVVTYAGIWWLGALVVKFFMRRPIDYAWDNAETTPLIVISAVLLWSLAFQVMHSVVTREAAASVLLGYVSPWVLLVSTVSLGGWIAAGPSKGANFLPLFSVMLVSGVSAYLVWYGFLSERGRLFNTRIAQHEAGTLLGARLQERVFRLSRSKTFTATKA